MSDCRCGSYHLHRDSGKPQLVLQPVDLVSHLLCQPHLHLHCPFSLIFNRKFTQRALCSMLPWQPPRKCRGTIREHGLDRRTNCVCRSLVALVPVQPEVPDVEPRERLDARGQRHHVDGGHCEAYRLLMTLKSAWCLSVIGHFSNGLYTMASR